jgi:DNA-binding NtrC family response regulator
MSIPKRILVVEDEMIIALDMESTLTELGHHVVSATTVTEAERAAAAGGIDLAIIDYHLKDGKTEDVARRLKTAGIPFVVCSGSSGLQEMGDIFQGTTFLAKPFTTEGLIEAVSNVTTSGHGLH